MGKNNIFIESDPNTRAKVAAKALRKEKSTSKRGASTPTNSTATSTSKSLKSKAVTTIYTSERDDVENKAQEELTVLDVLDATAGQDDSREREVSAVDETFHLLTGRP